MLQYFVLSFFPDDSERDPYDFPEDVFDEPLDPSGDHAVGEEVAPPCPPPGPPVDAAQLQSRILRKPDPYSHYLGNRLVNTRNHCYLISILQVMFSGTVFRKAAKSIDDINGTHFHDVLLNKRHELEWLRKTLHNNVFGYYHDRFAGQAETNWPGNSVQWEVLQTVVKDLAKNTLKYFPRYRSQYVDLVLRNHLPADVEELKKYWVDIKTHSASYFFFGEQSDPENVLDWTLNGRYDKF